MSKENHWVIGAIIGIAIIAVVLAIFVDGGDDDDFSGGITALIYWV